MFIRIPLEGNDIDVSKRYTVPLWATLKDVPIGGGLVGTTVRIRETATNCKGYHCHLYDGIELTEGLNKLLQTLRESKAPRGSVIIHGEQKYYAHSCDQK